MRAMQRPRCSVFIAQSLDGFIARPDGRLDFLEQVQLEGEDYGYAQFFGAVDAMVMGRNTLDVVHGFDAWPYEGKRVVVLTHRPLTSKHGEEAYAGELAPLLERLHAEGVSRIYVDGGHVIRQFLAAGFVDDLTLSIVPVLLGAGVPLFSAMPRELWLRAIDSRTFSSGLIQVRYTI